MRIHFLIALSFAIPTSAAERLDEYQAPQEGSVRIIRDTYGIPHIIARDNRSLFFGVGYAQAEDQLENLAKNYLRSEGRAAEREGKSQLATDHIVRLLKVPEQARRHYEQSDPETRAQLQGFADGVNAYAREHRDEIPDWIEPAEPHDVIGFAMYIDTMFSVSHCRRDLQGHGIKMAALEQLAPPFDLDFGSNQFAVSPDRSATGACQLSMDPHLRHSGFFRWYEMHLVGPEINVMGACFFGNPYVSMGRTEGTAWCMTVNGPDLGDVFAFEINPEDPTQYRGLDGWRSFESSEETYTVATENGSVEKTLKAVQSEVGPVLAVEDGTAYAFALPARDDPIRARQSYEMLKAKTVDEFRNALSHLSLVMFNIVYADKHGDIFYISNGRVPKRDERISSRGIRPGHEAWARWQGIHAQSDLPQLTNPSSGYVVNTNSGPQNVTPEGAPQPDAFPKYMMSQQANSRWRRLDHLLAADESITWDEMRTYATDTHVELADEYVPLIVEGINRHVNDAGENADVLREIHDVLEAWDRRTDLESKGAVLFFHLATDDAFVKAVQDRDPATAFTAAVAVAAQVRQRFGSLDVAWKQFSRIRRGDHEMGIAGTGSAKTESGITTIGAALRPTGGRIKDGHRYCGGGSSYGMIVDFSGKTRAVSCLPYGVSEHADSPHFADMLPLYAARQFKPVWFFPNEIAENTETQRVIEVPK